MEPARLATVSHSAQVLTREVPFSGCTDVEVFAKVREGRRPRRSANTTSPGITSSVWMLLGQCWDWKPDFRPNSTHVLNIIRLSCRLGGIDSAISWEIKLKMKDIVTDWKTKRSIDPYVALQYGTLVHAKSRAAAAGRDIYIGARPLRFLHHPCLMSARRGESEYWQIGLEEYYGRQMVTFQLFHRGSLPFRRRELLGTGKLFVSPNQRPDSSSTSLMPTYS